MNEHSYEFCEEQIKILKAYVFQGEEILSNIQTWEALSGILKERDHLIKKLQALEADFKTKKNQKSCTQKQEKEIADLFKLISDLDQNSISLIEKEQEKTIKDLKDNQKSQKVLEYKLNRIPTQGTFFDIKE